HGNHQTELAILDAPRGSGLPAARRAPVRHSSGGHRAGPRFCRPTASLVVTGNAGEKGLALGNPTATKPANTATCLSGGAGSNRWVSTELTCERPVVPGVPHFDYLAPRKAKENKLLYVDGVSGRRPRSPSTEVVDHPMRAGKA